MDQEAHIYWFATQQDFKFFSQVLNALIEEWSVKHIVIYCPETWQKHIDPDHEFLRHGFRVEFTTDDFIWLRVEADGKQVIGKVFNLVLTPSHNLDAFKI